MQLIRVETGQLEQTASGVEQLSEDYDAYLRQLGDKVDQLSEAWKGSDNNAFVSQIRGFEGDLRQLSITLRQYCDFLRNSARAYDETQQELTAEAGRIV